MRFFRLHSQFIEHHLTQYCNPIKNSVDQWLTSWYKVLLSQLVVTSLIGKCSVFMETGYLITLLQNARYWTVSWATSVSFPHPQSDCSKIYFTVLPPTNKCQKSGIFSWVFRPQNVYATDFTTYATGEIHFLILRVNIDSISRYRCKEFHTRFWLSSLLFFATAAHVHVVGDVSTSSLHFSFSKCSRLPATFHVVSFPAYLKSTEYAICWGNPSSVMIRITLLKYIIITQNMWQSCPFTRQKHNPRLNAQNF